MKCVVLSNYLNSKKDPQRSHVWKSDDFSCIKEWYNSLVKNRVSGVVFHDNLSDGFVDKYTNEYIRFHKVDGNYLYSTNDYRFFIMREFLLEHPEIEKLFMTDVSDVKMVQFPFDKMKEGVLYAGHDVAGNLKKNGYLKRRNMPKYYYELWNGLPHRVINAGVIGGCVDVVMKLLDEMVHEFEVLGRPDHNLNMAVFNYVAYKNFNGKMVVGPPVTSYFKKNQKRRKDVWFIHK